LTKPPAAVDPAEELLVAKLRRLMLKQMENR